MGHPLDYDDFMHTDSSVSDCECHRRFYCNCKVEGEEILVTNTTKILLGDSIGCGNFSSIRLGVDVNTGKPVAVKMQSLNEGKGPNWPLMSQQQKELYYLKKEDDDRLLGEFKSYVILDAVKKDEQKRYYRGLPVVYECGFYRNQIFLTMELLGPDLLDLFLLCDHQFSLKTVIQISVQLLETLKYIHDHGIIHRDIKPDNCMIGRKWNKTESVIHLVDFGNSRELIDRRRNAHIRPKIGQSLHGNARFASLNVHLGKELSRRDDLESLAYMMVYFMKGKLPWQVIDVPGDLQDLWSAVAETKRVTPISVLCDGLPQVFLDFTRYVRKLLFFDTPNYDDWIVRFTELYKSMKYSDVTEFDWTYIIQDEFEDEPSQVKP